MKVLDLVGTIQPPGTLMAPMSGAACVLYRVRLGLLQRLKDGWGDGGSKEIVGVRFTIICRMGEVIVDAARARLHLAPARRHRALLGQDPGHDARLGALYQRLLREPHRGGGKITALEQRLDPGGRVWACGDLNNIPDPSGLPAGYRLPPGRLLLRATEVVALPT